MAAGNRFPAPLMGNETGDPTDVGGKLMKTVQQISPAAVSLPSDLITEILIRLPVRSILRFKSVCRSWYALFSDPIFVGKHLKASNEDKDSANHRIIISSIYSTVVKSYSIASVMREEFSVSHDLDYPCRSLDAKVSIVGTVNGLVLIVVDKVGLFLWNPATRESNRLPPSGFEESSNEDPVYGFGYDESSSDYKVMVINNDKRRFTSYIKSEVRIYGLKSNSWSKIIENMPLCYLFGLSGKFVSGALHWSTCFGTGFDSNWEILTFNLCEETFSNISHPFSGETYSKISNIYYGERYWDSMIGVLDGCLCLLPKFNRTNVDVWVMKEYGKIESWYKMFSLDFPYGPNYFIYSRPLFVSMKKEVLLKFGVNLVLYNLEEATVSSPIIHDFCKRLPEIKTYIETLVSPYHEDKLRWIE